MPISINAEIRVFGLADFDFGKWELGDGTLRANSNACVLVIPSAPYQVTAYGSVSSNTFSLFNGGDELPYQVFFNDRARPSGATELQPGQVLGGLRGRGRGQNLRQCNRPTANLAIQILDSDLMASSPGQYSGTLIIVVGPE